MHDLRTIETQSPSLMRARSSDPIAARPVLKTHLMAAAVLLLMICLAAPARAAEDVTGRILSVGLGGTLHDVKTDVGKSRPSLKDQVGTYRWGTWVPVLVELKNSGLQPQQIYLSTQKDDLDDDKLTSMSPPVTLSPNRTRMVWLYYWPPPNDAGTGLTSVVIHDKPSGAVLGTATIPGLSPDDTLREREVSAIFPPDKAGASGHYDNNTGRFVLIIGQSDQGLGAFRDAFGGNADVVPVVVRSIDQIPEKALGLDGVDVIIWNTTEVSVIGNQDFQRKAILDWVRSGGHLILVAGTLWQQLGDLDSTDVLPATLSPPQPLSRKALLEYFTPRSGSSIGEPKLAAGPVMQLPAKLKPGARPVRASTRTDLDPIAFARPFGAGVVTLLTVDVDTFINDPDSQLTDANRLAFWNRIAGFRGDVLSNDERNHPKEGSSETRLAMGSVGSEIPVVLDVASVTQLRLLLAVLFLAVYWVFAGPGGHAILRAYKRTHWSWWIFGGMVVVAAVFAFAAAFFLRVTNETVRHHTYVLAAADARDASVVAYYGVLSPSSGSVNLSLPDGTGETWLAPFNQYVTAISGFSPRRYEIDTANPGSIDVPFRGTLKRMQARWFGPLGAQPLFTGELVRTNKSEFPLASTLVNNTGVPLDDVTIVYLHAAHESDAALESAYILRYPRRWAPGERLELTDPAPRFPDTLVSLLDELAATATAENIQQAHAGVDPDAEKPKYRHPYGDEFLSLFAEAMKPSRPLHSVGEIGARPLFHIGRPYTRAVDRTNTLRTMGAVIVARAGSKDDTKPPAPPLTVRLNGRDLAPSGTTIYAVGVQLRSEKPAPDPQKTLGAR